ncbi:O-antigen ligase family protein [Filibacter tadaridae]|uniref:O-Antigen ligase n=1 Tax=Filibacter tadaridae TaxID=2483811 RepID=A0A3P5WJT3_9BACL|nr:O-antigen ligase family protein [Filibacter tadaridae]VDC23903.1 O-Antigen ligase [Filibacter tadaridae]
MNLTSRLKEITVPLIGAALLLLTLLIPSASVAYMTTAILALAALIKPKQSILFLLIYFPLRSFLIEISPELKLVGDIVIIFAFLRVIWDSRKDVKAIFHFEVYEWAFIGFLGIGIISALLTGVGLMPIIFQIRAFVITFLLLYIVKRLAITKRDIMNFLILTLAVTIILIVQGLVEKLSMRSELMPEKWVNRSLSPNNKSRIYGLINNPNVLAVYLTISGLLTYYLKTLLPKNKMQWVLNIVLIVLAGTWILTFSRGTWIALVIGLAVYFLLTRNWKFIVKTGIAVALGFILVATPVTYATQWISSNTEIGNFERTGPAEDEGGFAVEKTRITETFNASTFDKSKTSGRLFIVSKGFEVFKDHLVIGTGFATFGDSASKTYSSPIYKDYDIDVDIYSDNQYIQIIAQTGFFGVLLFAVFLLGMLSLFWKKRKESKMAIPMLAALIGIFWCGLIYNIWEDKTFTMYYYILLAAFISISGRKTDLPE